MICWYINVLNKSTSRNVPLGYYLPIILSNSEYFSIFIWKYLNRRLNSCRFTHYGNYFVSKFSQFKLFKYLPETTKTVKNANYRPAGIFLFKVNNWNTRTIFEICSQLAIKTPERYYWCRSVVFLVNFEHVLHLFLVFLSLTSIDFCSITDFLHFNGKQYCQKQVHFCGK